MAADDESQTIPELITFLDQDKFRKLMAGFVESRSDVVNFSFWWQYMDMVAILYSTLELSEMAYAAKPCYERPGNRGDPIITTTCQGGRTARSQ